MKYLRVTPLLPYLIIVLVNNMLNFSQDAVTIRDQTLTEILSLS